MAIGKDGKIQQKTIQERSRHRTGSQQSNSPPDASIYLTLNEASGFWTATNITIIAAAGAVLVILIAFPGLSRSGRTIEETHIISWITAGQYCPDGTLSIYR